MVVERQKYKRSYCIEDGFQGELLIKKPDNQVKFNAYALPDVSVIPPIETQSCHFDLYYNGNVLVDTFYLFKDRPPTSRFKNWTIQHNQKFENRHQDIYLNYNTDHYHISLNVQYVENHTHSKSEGNH